MKRIACVLIILICIVGIVPVSARTQDMTYDDQYFRVTIGDDVLYMNSDTGKYAPVWLEAGISDAEERLDMMKQMNVLTMFFDKKTNALVNVICKMTEDTVKIFSFVGKSDEEILANVDRLMEGIDAPDENGNSNGVTYERSIIKHDQLPFFRIMLDINNDEMLAKEVIYGTVVNGRLIEIDQFAEDNGEIDETFIKGLVDSVYVTKFITHEEYEDLVKVGKIKIWIALGCLILLIVGLFVFVTINKKKKEKKTVRISENLRAFRERRARGEVDCKTVVAMGRATYSIKAVDRFVMYNTWIRNAVVEVILFAFLALIVTFCVMSDSILYGILVGACGLVSVYFNYTGGEKNKANMIARFDARNKPVARFVFYEEFFTMTGAGALSEFTYEQVASVRLFNEYMYIFFGTDQGVFIERDSLGDEDIVKLISHIKSHKA